MNLRRLDESLALFKAALKLGRRVFEVDSSELLTLEENTVMTLSELGGHEEAAEVYKRLIDVREQWPLYGPSHETAWHIRSESGRAFVKMGKFSEAISLLRDSMAAHDTMGLGPEHPQFGIIPQQLGMALLGAGRPDEAPALYHI